MAHGDPQDRACLTEEERRAALAEMVALGEEAGFYDLDPEDNPLLCRNMGCHEPPADWLNDLTTRMCEFVEELEGGER